MYGVEVRPIPVCSKLALTLAVSRSLSPIAEVEALKILDWLTYYLPLETAQSLPTVEMYLENMTEVRPKG